jgi:hypothetical protein
MILQNRRGKQLEYLEVGKVHDKIVEELLLNQDYLFNLQELYSRKYSYLSDYINDVNVGLFLNDKLQPTIQIFVRNKFGYIKTELIFNKLGTELINTITKDGRS